MDSGRSLLKFNRGSLHRSHHCVEFIERLRAWLVAFDLKSISFDNIVSEMFVYCLVPQPVVSEASVKSEDELV